MNRLVSPRTQIVISWVLLIGSVVAWPATSLTVFANEPQGILGLSWFAIILGAFNTLVTTAVNDEVTPSPKGPHSERHICPRSGAHD